MPLLEKNPIFETTASSSVDPVPDEEELDLEQDNDTTEPGPPFEETFKEDEEQDLDDLVHNPPRRDNVGIPPPDEV